MSEGWQQFAPLKVATHGSAFRYERPQKGRFREFHQLDAEIIGAAEPQADVELLSLGYHLLQELGIADGVTLELNTLGDPDTREAWRAALVEHFMARKDELSEDSAERLVRNPLRILDSKDPRDRKVCADAPSVDEFLTNEAAEFFSAVVAGIEAASVPWVRNARLVRGLDYYRHTAFEFVTDRLGAQGTVIAGGRYDGLMEALGGAHTPAVGWAAGIERLAMMIEAPQAEITEVAVVVENDDAIGQAVAATGHLRRNGLSAELYATGSPRKRRDRAVKRGALTILTLDVSDGRISARLSGDAQARVAGAMSDFTELAIS